MHSGVVNVKHRVPASLFKVTHAQRIGHVPAKASYHHFQRVVEPFNNFAWAPLTKHLRKLCERWIVVDAFGDRTIFPDPIVVALEDLHAR